MVPMITDTGAVSHSAVADHIIPNVAAFLIQPRLADPGTFRAARNGIKKNKLSLGRQLKSRCYS